MTGSGIYWLLSSQSIASFTVLAPGLFQSNSYGVLLVLILGLVSCVSGLWVIDEELEKIHEVLNRPGGWIFTLPILLPVADVCLTLFGLQARPEIMELNPVVGDAIRGGIATLAPFLISYMLLSEGLALLMLYAGQLLVESSSLVFLPFSMVCGSAAFGPLSNLALITAPQHGPAALVLGVVTAAGLSGFVYYRLRRSYGSVSSS